MAKDRLSKLQKWILAKCLNDLQIHYRNVFEFFGKRFTLIDTDFKVTEMDGNTAGYYTLERLLKDYPSEYYEMEEHEGENYYGMKMRGYNVTTRKEFIITNSEKAIISRSLKGLAKKRLLIQLSKWGRYELTEAGFLKANSMESNCHLISFKEYQGQTEKLKQEWIIKCKERDAALIAALGGTNKVIIPG